VFKNGGRLSAYQRNSPQRRCNGTLEREGARAGNESHVADACPCWVVRGQESVPGQSAPQENAAGTLCKKRHAKRSCLLCKFEQTPGALRLLTVAEDLSAEWWLSTGGQGFMRADSRVGRSCGVTLLHSTCGCGCGCGCRRRESTSRHLDQCSVQGAHAGPSRCTCLDWHFTSATILGGNCEWECVSFAGRILGRLHGTHAIGN